MKLALAVAALIVVVAGFFLLSGTAPGARIQRQDDSNKLHVAATLFPLADWLRNVGGSDVDVECLVSGAANPHHFEPTIQDALRITSAKALFAVGLELDPWARKLNERAGGQAEYIETGTWIEPLKMPALKEIEIENHAAGDHDEDEHHHHHGDWDPHYWLDPQRAQIVVKKMAEELGRIDPPHRDDYARRAAAYALKLDALNKQIDAQKQVTLPGREIVTFHDAYGYLLSRLGMKIAAVVQVSPGVEPSAKDVAEAVRIMRELPQHTVYREPDSNSAAIELLAGELHASVAELDPMDTEFSDVGHTYIDRLQHDLEVLAKK